MITAAKELTGASGREATLGAAVRSIRLERGWSLKDASERTGLSVSMLSKVENGQRSLTYDKLVNLAESLAVDISRLFTTKSAERRVNLHVGRRSVHRSGEGFVIESGVYTYKYLAHDLMRKRFLPVLMEIHARSVSEFDDLLRHEGEEFALVLDGEVDVYTEVYAPLRLKEGESVFFDSTVGHAYLNAGPGTARLIVIASDATANAESTNLPMAKSAHLAEPRTPPGTTEPTRIEAAASVASSVKSEGTSQKSLNRSDTRHNKRAPIRGQKRGA